MGPFRFIAEEATRLKWVYRAIPLRWKVCRLRRKIDGHRRFYKRVQNSAYS